MRKSYLQSGPPILVVNVKHFVTDIVFAKALASHFYSRQNDFPLSLNKKEGWKILLVELKYGGEQSCFDVDGVFSDATEFLDSWEPIYIAALEWVLKNYPHLKT